MRGASSASLSAELGSEAAAEQHRQQLHSERGPSGLAAGN